MSLKVGFLECVLLGEIGWEKKMFGSEKNEQPCPTLIAHGGGKGDWPENTIYAIDNAISAGIHMIEFDVQVNVEGIPVLYRSSDLSALTNGTGPVSNATLEYLQSLDAAYYFKPEEGYPLRGTGITIPTLNETLKVDKSITLIIDMKSLPAQDLVDALINSIPDEQYSRLIFYSTNDQHLELLLAAKPSAVTFESRTLTKQRLLNYFNTHLCSTPSHTQWLGFELARDMVVKENLTLGATQNTVTFKLWTTGSVSCTRGEAVNANVVGLGVNSITDYMYASSLGLDAIYTDYPKEFIAFDCKSNSPNDEEAKSGFFDKKNNVVWLSSALAFLVFVALCYMAKQNASKINNYCGGFFKKASSEGTSFVSELSRSSAMNN
jgi:glycerophosphoryl diester phosphodiesterase